MNKGIIAATALYLMLLISISAESYVYAAELVDRIVAVVDDDVITQTELEESMLPFVADYRVRYGEEGIKDKMDEARADALNRLIEEKLLLHEAKRREILVDDKEVEGRLEDVKRRFESEDEFYRAIEASGVSVAKLKSKYKEQIMMKKLVSGLLNSRVHISPTQIEAYYHGNKKAFTLPKAVRFKILLLKPLPERNKEETMEMALEVLEKVRSGEDFDMLVKQYSQGPNIEISGDMGYMPEGSIIEELDRAILKLEPGETSDLIKTDTGFNIVKVVDKRSSGIKSLNEVDDLIRERLYQRESELTLREFMNKLKEDAYIKIQ